MIKNENSAHRITHTSRSNSREEKEKRSGFSNCKSTAPSNDHATTSQLQQGPCLSIFSCYLRRSCPPTQRPSGCPVNFRLDNLRNREFGFFLQTLRPITQALDPDSLPPSDVTAWDQATIGAGTIEKLLRACLCETHLERRDNWLIARSLGIATPPENKSDIKTSSLLLRAESSG